MALSAKLVMRQGQAMVMTPQLLQAIKLLQLPNIELAAYIENELERNPLLERADDFSPSEPASEPAALFEGPAPPEGEADWASQAAPSGAAKSLGRSAVKRAKAAATSASAIRGCKVSAQPTMFLSRSNDSDV